MTGRGIPGAGRQAQRGIHAEECGCVGNFIKRIDFSSDLCYNEVSRQEAVHGC